MVDTVIAFGSGDQPPVCFDLSADSRSILPNVFSYLRNLQSLLQTCLDGKPVIVCKVFMIHGYLRSEGRTRITIPEKETKRNHEVTTATPWLLWPVILTATAYVAINFSIDLKIYAKRLEIYPDGVYTYRVDIYPQGVIIE